MVRRQGKKRVQAVLESGNNEKKKEGDSSFSRVDVSGAREPMRHVYLPFIFLLNSVALN
jgi:hypothetical protein